VNRVVNWTGLAVATTYVIVVGVLLYLRGLAADQNPGGDNRIDGLLWALGIGLIAIIAGTIAVSRLISQRSR
jgi:uncharacterized membrane protein